VKLAPWQFVVVGLVVGVVLAGGVALAMSGGSSKPATQVAVQATQPPPATSQPQSSNLQPTSTPVPATPVPPPPPPPPPTAPTEPPVRTNCDLIKATGYQSDAERNYFLANCTGAAAAPGPAATVRPAATAVPLAGGSAAAVNPDEQRYRDQAAAQLGYLNAQLAQFYNGNAASYGATAALLQLCTIAGNVANAMDSLQPVPPRFKGVHDEMRSSHVAFRNDCVTITSVSTLGQFNTWLIKFDNGIDRMNSAIDDFDRVVGIQLASLRR
jgi:hypothetical protein